MSTVIAFESSCDETGVALVRDAREVLANEVASQIDLHAGFGGVVPEIASRQHTRVIVQLTGQCLRDAGVARDGRGRPAGGPTIDAVAATAGPGLMGSLLVGVCFAKSLARAWDLPFVPVHHIEGHLYSAFLGERAPGFPFLALVVSGGHTQLIDCPRPHAYEILGTTRDDAVGESFDKVARLLGLPYPGGPAIQRAAEGGDPAAYGFPRAMRDSGDLAFSYSGLKTAVLYAIREGATDTANLAASFQQAAIDILVIKTQQALARTGHTRLVLAGGVAANRLLRERLAADLDADVFLPPLEYCADNAAMIAAAACSRHDHHLHAGLDTVPNPALRL